MTNKTVEQEAEKVAREYVVHDSHVLPLFHKDDWTSEQIWERVQRAHLAGQSVGYARALKKRVAALEKKVRLLEKKK